jgi:hypothetical protein
VIAAKAIRSRRIALLGWILYVVSWLTPSLDGSQLGARAFVTALTTGLRLVIHAGSVAPMIIGLCLLLGWLANFSILLRWPVRARLAWMIVPWVPFIALLCARGIAPSPIPLLYFYPWAIGIALIHGARVSGSGAYGD